MENKILQKMKQILESDYCITTEWRLQNEKLKTRDEILMAKILRELYQTLQGINLL